MRVAQNGLRALVQFLQKSGGTGRSIDKKRFFCYNKNRNRKEDTAMILFYETASRSPRMGFRLLPPWKGRIKVSNRRA